MLETSAAYSRQAAEDGEEESKLKKKKTSTQDQKQCVSDTCVIQIPFLLHLRSVDSGLSIESPIAF